MKILRQPSTGRPRSALTVLFLLLTLGLAAVLAYHAQDAARSHRQAAEGAIRDYTAFATWQYKRSANEYLYEAVMAEFRPVVSLSSVSPGAFLPHPDVLLAKRAKRNAADCGCPRVDSIQDYFQVDLRDGAVRTARGALPAALHAWIADTVAARARSIPASSDPRSCFGSLVATIQGRSTIIAYHTVRDDQKRPVAVYGFVADPSGLAANFRRAMQRTPLLPPSLIRDSESDSLLSVAVFAGTGASVYQSPVQYPLTFAGEDTLGARFEGVRLQVALRPQAAQQLVIGGLPRSRLPLLLGLLALTAGLVAVALLQMRREAALARLRSNFVSGVSHELRTPLAQIRMFAETLLLGRVRSEEERQRSLEIIDQEARRLTHLVENVLHFSRTERHVNRIDPQPIELATQIREIVESFVPLARARQTSMRTEFSAGVIALADAGALRQLLLNLLDNALKYGPAGQTVTVGMALVGDRVRIRVDDQGPGIPSVDRERIWEAFRRLKRDTQSAVGGSGIGLAVVREIVLLHGGSVWVEEAPGGGARFVVELAGARPGVAGADENWSGTPSPAVETKEYAEGVAA
jgi:signal transduction histidine kinase